MIVTTARKPDAKMEADAREIAGTYQLNYIVRGNKSLEELLGLDGKVLLLSSEGLSCHTRGGKFFLHPNMAAVRIKLLRQGLRDKMLEVMNLLPGDSVLDCTAGFCADSLVAKYGVGDQGKVVALEKSLPIYIVVKHGLETQSGPERFLALAEGITLLHRDFRGYLAELPPKSFDVVYFDPMFDAPVQESSSLLPLRPLACHEGLTAADIRLAARAARKRVVVKQRSFFDFASLGLTKVPGGQSRRVAYGFLDTRRDSL